METVFPSHNATLSDVTMTCESEGLQPTVTVTSSQISVQIVLTLSAVAFFVGTKSIVNRIRRDLAHVTIIVVGAGPVGLTSALIAVRCKRVEKVIVFEERSKCAIENQVYQIAITPSVAASLRHHGIDFDNLEGIWNEGCFYTRVGIYLEYIISVLPICSVEVEFKFSTKFTKDTNKDLDTIRGRKLLICCDGNKGAASRYYGISDEFVQHASGIYGAVAAIERPNQTLVPTPEKRIHNLTFDLSAYNSSAYEGEDGRSKFSLKIFGNSRCRYLSLAVNKSESNVVKALKTILDKSMMRNIFLKCFNTYKLSEEHSISDSYCLNNMKYSPRLFEIKVSQRIENVAYVDDCDVFVIIEGEASRSYNFDTGLDVNIGLKGLMSLQPFIEKISLADTEHSIMAALIYKMEHSDKVCKDLLKHGLKEYIFL